MDSLSETAARILEIETRQDGVLRELAALDRQVERILAECLASVAPLRLGADLSAARALFSRRCAKRLEPAVRASQAAGPIPAGFRKPCGGGEPCSKALGDSLTKR